MYEDRALRCEKEIKRHDNDISYLFSTNRKYGRELERLNNQIRTLRDIIVVLIVVLFVLACNIYYNFGSILQS